MRQKNLYRKIKEAVNSGVLDEQFSVEMINQRLNNLLAKSSAFLAKHAKGNRGDYSEMFIRKEKGKYILNPTY